MKKQSRTHKDDYPANEQESTADLFQWFFHLEEVLKFANQRINTRSFASALNDLSTASRGDNAHEVRLAWQLFLDTVGPAVVQRFVTTGAWKRFCPEPDHDAGTPSLAVLWRKGGRSVVGRLQFLNEVVVGVRFDVE